MKLKDIRKALRSEGTNAEPTKGKALKVSLIACARCDALGQKGAFRITDVFADRWVCPTCDAEDKCDWQDCDRDADFEDEAGKLCSKHHLEHMAKMCRACLGTGTHDGTSCIHCDGEGVL